MSDSVSESLTRRLAIGVVFVLVVAGIGSAVVPLFFGGGGTAYETGSGLVVSTSVDHGVGAGNPFTGTDTVAVGNVTFSASGEANVTVDRFEGEWTNVSQVDASSTAITVDPDDKDSVTISGDGADLSFRDVALDDGTVDFVYSASGDVTITVGGLPANTNITAGSVSGLNLTRTETDSNGDATLTLPSGTSTNVVLFQPATPSVDNSSADPADGDDVSDYPIQFSINVSDADFATKQGDELNASLYVDGTYKESTTVAANGTARVTRSGITGGDHTYYWVVEDNWGESVTSQTFDFGTPSSLAIKRETNGEFIDSADVTIRFYGDETTAERETNTGNISFAGLPVDEEFVVVATADGYYERRIVIDSLFEQKTIYLLNESVPALQNTFVLQDYSNRFETRSTKLIVEKSINISGDTQYRVIAGDYFGASSEFPIVLEEDTRYRLRVENQDGEVRDLGDYVSSEAGVQSIRIGQVKPPRPQADTYTATVNVTQLDDSTERVWFAFNDTEDKTTNLVVRVEPRSGAGNVLFTDTVSGPLGTYSASIQVPDNSVTYVVNWTATRGGTEIGGKRPVGGVKAPLIPVDSHLLSGVVFVAVVFLLAQAVPAYRGEVAMTSTAFGGVAMALQAINISPFGWWAAAVISVGLYISGRQ
jgi:hypothetical protein